MVGRQVERVGARFYVALGFAFPPCRPTATAGAGSRRRMDGALRRVEGGAWRVEGMKRKLNLSLHAPPYTLHPHQSGFTTFHLPAKIIGLGMTCGPSSRDEGLLVCGDRDETAMSIERVP